MQTRPLAVLMAALCGFTLPLSAEVREFHDTKGRTIKAELLKARGPNIVIRNAEGKEVPVPLKSLSRDDIIYVSRWIAAEPTALDYRFDVKEVEKIVQSMPTAGRPSGYAAYGTADESIRGYDLSLSNRCQNPVEGIRACYRVFMLDCVDVSESGYATTRSRKLLFKSGNVVLPTMAYNGSHKFTTRAHTMHKMKAQNNFYGTNEKDRLRGVWVRFFRHGVQVAEWKSGTVPKCEWPESNSEKALLEDDQESQKPLLAALTAPPTQAVKPAPPPAIPTKSRVEDKGDIAEEMKIFDLEDVLEEKDKVIPPKK